MQIRLHSVCALGSIQLPLPTAYKFPQTEGCTGLGEPKQRWEDSSPGSSTTMWSRLSHITSLGPGRLPPNNVKKWTRWPLREENQCYRAQEISCQSKLIVKSHLPGPHLDPAMGLLSSPSPRVEDCQRLTEASGREERNNRGHWLFYQTPWNRLGVNQG